MASGPFYWLWAIVLVACLAVAGCRRTQHKDYLPLTTTAASVNTEKGRVSVIYGLTGRNQPRRQTPMVVYLDCPETGEWPEHSRPALTVSSDGCSFVVSVGGIERPFGDGCVVLVTGNGGFECVQVASSWDRALFTDRDLLESFIRGLMTIDNRK